ncbi:hypothetical protein LTS10_008970 [Elasticomyces elasticus]|nr:hypothetical protein LTS10_008970 [Elasticomyces elasticus]
MPKRSREADGPVQNRRRSKRLSAKNKDDAEHTEQTQECKLFALPAELRNSIYEDVLIEDAKIEVTVNTRVPALLQVSKQTREETLSMWLQTNTFNFTITNCDASLICGWERFWSARKFRELKIKINMVLVGTPNWSALMKWCKEVCEDEAGAATPQLTDTKFGGIITTATGIAWRFSEFYGPWARCEKVLGELRHSAALEDADWLL